MFIGREIRRSHAFWRGEQAAELGVTPKSLFGDLLEVNKRSALLREFALEFCKGRVIAFERLRAATLSIQQAFLRDVLLAAFVVLDSLQRRAIAGFLSLVDSGFSLFVPRPELCRCLHFGVCSQAPHVRRDALQGASGVFQVRGRCLEVRLQVRVTEKAFGLLQRGIQRLKGVVEVVQERDSLTDRQMATHNRS